MLKLISGAIAGIFIGAFAFELLARKLPKEKKYIEEKATKLGNLIASSFLEPEENIDDYIRE